MASTRNKNTLVNYKLQQAQNTDAERWELYKNGANGFAYQSCLPGNGLNPAQYPQNVLSQNGIDIETFLFGINSTNLVQAPPPLTPHLNYLSSANVFERTPTLMPTPFIQSREQRPFPI